MSSNIFPPEYSSMVIQSSIANILETEKRQQQIPYKAIAIKGKITDGRVYAVLTGITPNPGILTVMKILHGLGRNLKWLAEELECKQ
jgi:hypothetical protein